MPPASTNVKSLLAELEPRHHGRRGRHQLVGGAIQDSGCDHIAFVSRVLHVLRDGRDRPRAQLLVIHLVNQLGRARRRRSARAAAASGS